MTRATSESGWFRLANQAAKNQASIHDDEKARELGFRRGFVPGTTVSIAVLGAIVDHFGKAWFEGGWHDLKFVDPAYDDEDLQVSLEPDPDGTARLAVVTKAGRLTCSGLAGLGGDRQFPSPLPASGDAFPGSIVDTRFEERPFTPTLRDSLGALRAAGAAGRDAGEWCRSAEASPWGKALAPPAGLLPVTRWAQNQLPLDGALLPAMNARMQVAYRRPVFVDEPLIATTWLAGKSASGRTWSRTIGFSLRDEDGSDRAHGMHTIRWWTPTKATER